MQFSRIAPILSCNSIARNMPGFQRFHLKYSAFQIYYNIQETLEGKRKRKILWKEHETDVKRIKRILTKW